MNPTMTV